MKRDIKTRLREVTAFFRFETNDRVASAASLSEEAADYIEKLERRLEEVEYFLQHDMRNRLEPRVIDIAYTAWEHGRLGKNKDDGGPCDWFTDTRPLIMKGINTIRKEAGFEVI